MITGSGPYQALAGRLEQILEDTRRVVERAGHLLENARQTGDDGYIAGNTGCKSFLLPVGCCTSKFLDYFTTVRIRYET